MLKRREWCKEELETHLWYDPIENIWKAYDVYESVGDDSDTFG